MSLRLTRPQIVKRRTTLFIRLRTAGAEDLEENSAVQAVIRRDSLAMRRAATVGATWSIWLRARVSYSTLVPNRFCGSRPALITGFS
jgi:hypothetical protein